MTMTTQRSLAVLTETDVDQTTIDIAVCEDPGIVG